MSADGASEVVRNATRSVIESTTAIKGLTGLDVPSLIGSALGRSFGEQPKQPDGDGESAADRIGKIAGEGLTTLKARAVETASAAKVEADEAAAKAEAEARHAKETADKAAAAAQAKASSVVARVGPSDGNITQWLKWLADQLRRVPDIQVYDALHLVDLETRGPAAARGVWNTARAVLAQEYGKLTIGEFLSRFQS
jgi:hypothetical protein